MTNKNENDKKEIIIYTTTTCPYCTIIKRYLDNNNITYTEKNITNPQNLQELTTTTKQKTLPTTIINNTIITGYNLQKIKETLQKT
jgi:glutaredoxin 3